MRLVSMDLKGFKSFPEATHIAFHSGITVIVGPNGSGKSNVTDAVRWVLGEQSAKTLRGGKMEDVIFSGTHNRKPLGFAEVILTFDNSDGTLPLAFETVEVRRRLYRSGESEYALNKTKCRLKDIVELFMDSGIGRDGYSIVGQGRIDEVLSPKTEDRRLIFDEASGISKYRSRRDEALRKLRKTEENLSRVQDILGEIERRIKPLEKEAGKARLYLELSETLKNSELHLFFYDFIKAAESLKEVLVKLDINQSELADKTEEKTAFLLHNEALEKELFNLRQTLKNLSLEKELQQNKVNLIQTEVVKVESALEALEREEKQGLSNLEEKKSQYFELKETIDSLNKDYEFKAADLAAKKAEKEALAQTVQDKDVTLSTHRLKLQEEEENLRKTQEDLLSLQHTYISLEGESTKFQMENEALLSRKDVLENEINQLKETIHTESDSLSAIKEEALSSLSLFEETRKTLDSKKSRQISLKKEIATSTQDLSQVDYALRNLKHLIENHEGYQASVKKLLTDVSQHKTDVDKSDVPGAVASLIEVPEDLEMAIETALGGNAQNVVVSKEEVAARLITHLKAQSLGRVTFLPLDRLKVSKLKFSDYSFLKNEEGFLGLASELVSCDASHQKAIDYRLGRILLAKDLSSARYFNKKTDARFQWVTLDAEVIWPGGALSGGAQRQARTFSVFARKRECSNLETKRLKLQKQLERLISEQEKLEDSIQELQQTLEKTMLTLTEKKEQVRQLEKNLDYQKLMLKAKEEDHLLLEKKKEDLEKNRTERIAFQKETKSKQETLELQITQKVSKLAELREEEKTLLSSVSSEQELLHSIELEFARMELSVNSMFQTLEEKKRLFSNLQDLLEQSNFLAEEAQRNLKELKQRKSDLDLRLDSETKVLASLKETQASNEALLEQKVEENKGFLEALNTLNSEETALKGEALRLEAMQEKIQLKQDDLLQKIWESYALTQAEAPQYFQEHLNRTETQRLIAETKAKIKALGPVNLNAVEEYDEVSERYDFLTTQQEDILTARKDLDRLVLEITEEMKLRFASSFEFIREKFRESFQELFGGGEATIRLSSETDILNSDIDIHVCPPGKRMQNMMLLSGGERCLTAIALLFALQQLKASAFCILDEVESALDDANIFRFTEYIKKYASSTQFILVTHRKGTMEAAERIYGVTMQEKGVSKLLSLNLEEVD